MLDWRFAWIADGTIAFDLAAHNRLDLDPVSVEIHEEEEQDATFTVTVARSDFGVLSAAQRWAWLSYVQLDGTLVPVALGQRTTVPLGKKEGLISLDFVCRPTDWQVRRQIALEPLKVLPYFDAVLMDPSRLEDPVEILDGTTRCVHIDRTTHSVTATDMLGIDLPLYRTFTADQIACWDEGGVSVECRSAPLAGVLLTIESQWEQSLSGTYNLTNAVQAAFPSGCISTLTPEQFEKSWFKVGQSLGGNSGYVVTVASLSVTSPPSGYGAICGPVYGSTAVYNYVTNPNLNPLLAGSSLPIKYYTGELQVSYASRQKRVESVEVLVLDGGQKTHIDGEIRQLFLRCQDVSRDMITQSYQAGMNYSVGAVVRSGNRNYTCTVGHTATSPDFALDFFSLSGSGVTERWSQNASDNSPIGGPDRSTYFRQARGRGTVQAGILKARRLLALSRRNVDVTFYVPFCDVTDLTTAAQIAVQVDGSVFPGGWAQGKVKSISVSDTDPQSYAKATIKLACATGSGVAATIDTQGQTLWSISGAPASTLGVDGDWAYDGGTSRIYGPKETTWPPGYTDLKLLAGLPVGQTYTGHLYSGLTQPVATTGGNGDFWFQTSANMLYGPKLLGSWPSTGVSLGGVPGSPTIPFSYTYFANYSENVWDQIPFADYTAQAEIGLGTVTGVATVTGDPEAQLSYVKANDFSTQTKGDPVQLLRKIQTAV